MKLERLTEARVARGKTLSWFIKNFLQLEDDDSEDDYIYHNYSLREQNEDGAQLEAYYQGDRVVGVTFFKKGNKEVWKYMDRYSESVGSGSDPRKDLAIRYTLSKIVWKPIK